MLTSKRCMACLLAVERQNKKKVGKKNMKKQELINEMENLKLFYEERKKRAEKMEHPGIEDTVVYGDWWYEKGVESMINLFLEDLQSIIDELEAPF